MQRTAGVPRAVGLLGLGGFFNGHTESDTITETWWMIFNCQQASKICTGFSSPSPSSSKCKSPVISEEKLSYKEKFQASILILISSTLNSNLSTCDLQWVTPDLLSSGGVYCSFQVNLAWHTLGIIPGSDAFEMCIIVPNKPLSAIPLDKLCFLCLSEAGPCWVVQVNLELLTLLPQLPQCWDYKNGSKQPASIFGLKGFYS